MTKTLLDRIDHLIQYYKDEDTSHNYGDLDVAQELEEIREEWNKWNAVIDDLEMTVRSYMVKVDGLESAIAAEKEGNRWIPVSERLPNKDRWYGVRGEGFARPMIFSAGVWECLNGRITHWCEIRLPTRRRRRSR